MSTCENYDTTNPTILTIEGVYKHGENQALNVSQQVVFRDIQRDGSGNITSQDVIPIERNNLYKVILTPKYDNGALEFDEIDYAIQVADWQTGETIVFAGNSNLTAQSTPSFTVTNASSISGTEADGVTNPTLVISGIEDHSIYLTVTSTTTGTMLSCPTFPSNQYGLVSSATTNDAEGNLVETYKIDIDANISRFEAYTFTLSNAINTNLAKAFVLRKEPVLNIGDYYYTDGTWSTDYISGKTIAGIVFSVAPSDYDVSQGFLHGYAVALKDCSDGSNTIFAWRNENNAESSDGINSCSSYSELDGSTYTYDNDLIYNTIIADIDGYKHTMTIRNKANYSVVYPAFNAALSYTGGISFSMGVVNSGWYLPSLGQYYWMFVNLCSKIAAWPGTAEIGKNATSFDVIDNSPVNNFNTYLQQRIVTDAGKSASYYSPLRTYADATTAYWDYITSSEQIRNTKNLSTGITSQGYMAMTFRQYKSPADKNNTVRFDPNIKTISGPVRAVIAF